MNTYIAPWGARVADFRIRRTKTGKQVLEILLVRVWGGSTIPQAANQPQPFYTSKERWAMPGGKKEPEQDNPLAVLDAEYKEETGLGLDLRRLLDAGSPNIVVSKPSDRIGLGTYTETCFLLPPERVPESAPECIRYETDEIAEVRWFELGSVPLIGEVVLSPNQQRMLVALLRKYKSRFTGFEKEIGLFIMGVEGI